MPQEAAPSRKTARRWWSSAEARTSRRKRSPPRRESQTIPPGNRARTSPSLTSLSGTSEKTCPPQESGVAWQGQRGSRRAIARRQGRCTLEDRSSVRQDVVGALGPRRATVALEGQYPA